MRDSPNRRTVAAALLSAGLAGMGDKALAQASSLASGSRLPAPEQPDATFERLQDSVRRVAVEVLINGRGPFVFVVDTGANRSVIAQEIAETLALPDAGVMRVHGIGGPENIPTVRVTQMRIGNIREGMLRLPVMPRQRLGIDGLLGVDVLMNRQVLFDFGADRLEIGPSQTETGSRMTRKAFEGATVLVRARQRFGQLNIIDAELGRVPITAFIDTGAQRTVGNIALRDAVRLRHPDVLARDLRVPVVGALGQTVIGEVGIVPVMRLGGATFSTFPMVFANLHTFSVWQLERQPAVLLGMDLLRVFDAVVVDFASKEVRFRVPRRIQAPR